MSGGVTDGQPVDAATTDAAFLHKNAPEQMPTQLDLTYSNPSSGANVVDIQKNINSISSFLGWILNSVYNVLPSWATNNRGLSTNNVKQRIEAIDTAFDPSTGHAHTGGAGDAPKLNAILALISTGAAAGKVLTADGSGGVSWADATGGGSMIYEEPTGNIDGSNTSFTLSMTPSMGSDALVLVDGVALYPNEYSLTGTTLTLNTAPALGTEVTCAYAVEGGGGGGSSGAYVVYGNRLAGLSIAAASTIATSTDQRQMRFLQSTGGSYMLSSTPQIASSATVGAELLLMGTSSTDYIILQDGNGFSLNGNCNLTDNQALYCVSDGSVWREVSRRM